MYLGCSNYMQHSICHSCIRDNCQLVQIHTVQPDSFSTVGAFSTVRTVLDES